MTEKLRLRREDPVATIEINNLARRNAFDLAMWEALPGLVAQAESDPALRVIVLRGTGEACFCSGADISEFQTLRASASGGRAYEQANIRAFEALNTCSKPTIAAIRQFCMGGGMGLAAACDLRLAEEGTQFAIPAARLGVGYPPQSMALIVAAIGNQAAMDLFFTARRFEAQEAHRLGFLARIIAKQDFESETAALANMIAANAPLTLAAAKAAIRHASALPLAPSLGQCEALANACFDSADYVEGQQAFLNKRPPLFTGK